MWFESAINATDLESVGCQDFPGDQRPEGDCENGRFGIRFATFDFAA